MPTRDGREAMFLLRTTKGEFGLSALDVRNPVLEVARLLDHSGTAITEVLRRKTQTWPEDDNILLFQTYGRVQAFAGLNVLPLLGMSRAEAEATEAALEAEWRHILEGRER